MADVQFAPPLQRSAPPLVSAPVPPPPPPPAPIPAPLLRLSAPVPVVRDTSSTPAISIQDFIQPAKLEAQSRKRKKKKRGKKLLTFVVLLGLIGGIAYYFRNAESVQRLFGRGHEAAPLPVVPFVRPSMTTADYSVTLSAVQNGVPNNATTKVMVDYINGIGQSTVETQTGGSFATAQEIRTPEFVFHPGAAVGAAWTRQPRAPDTPSPYDSADFIPMINDVVDQTLRDAVEPNSSKSEKVGTATITSLHYVLDRSKVPEIAPAIFARAPWLFDVPNATTLTVDVSYDESGVVRHLYLGVDPPQPGTGIDATWVTGYTMDVTSLNVPVAIVVPVDAVDVPVGTP